MLGPSERILWVAAVYLIRMLRANFLSLVNILAPRKIHSIFDYYGLNYVTL